MKTKAQWRKEILAWRSQLPPALVQALSQAITQRCLSLPEVQAAHIFLGYLSFRQEVQTDDLLASLLKEGKTVAVPVTDLQNRTMVPARLFSLHEGLFVSPLGIREPAVVEVVPPEKIQIIFLPGVAFDRQGYRLGYGAGYYDRFLASLPTRPLLIGLAYEKQVVWELPHEPHDHPVDLLITEANLYRCAQQQPGFRS